MSEWWIVFLGMVAGLLTTGSFVPQVIKAWRGGDRMRSPCACTS